MFDSLSDRLNDTFDRLRGKGKLTEADILNALEQRALIALKLILYRQRSPHHSKSSWPKSAYSLRLRM